MFDFLEKLREKPERVKKQVAFIVALSISGIIFVVWLSVIFPSWRSSQVETQSSEPSPLASFTSTFSSGLSDISSQFSKIKNIVSSLSTSTVYYNSTTTQQ